VTPILNSDGGAGDGSDRVAPATLLILSMADHERRWSDAVRPVTGNTDVLQRDRRVFALRLLAGSSRAMLDRNERGRSNVVQVLQVLQLFDPAKF